MLVLDFFLSLCMDIPHFIYPFLSWWTFGFFSLWGCLWIILLYIYIQVSVHNKTCTFVYKFLMDIVFISLVRKRNSIPRNGIAVLCSNSGFNLLRICQTVFQSSVPFKKEKIYARIWRIFGAQIDENIDILSFGKTSFKVL